MNRTLASADTAHYYPRPAQLSTLLAACRLPFKAPRSVKVGFDATALAVNVATDTIYVGNSVQKNSPFGGNTVSVIDGTSCHTTNTAGCARAPRTIILGPALTTPAGVAIDQATDTIYVADLQNSEGSGTVSVINGAICNATITTRCGQTPPAVKAGFGRDGTVSITSADR